MRRLLAALALAGALIPFTPAHAAEPLVRIAQMARDVTDAVRKQCDERRERVRTDDRTRRKGKR